jgi:Ca-activated chloride channel family protein
MNYDCPNHPILFDRAGAGQKRAACIALFAMKLQQSGFASQISWMDLEKMARKNFASNDFVDKEYMAMVTRARKIYEQKR